MNKRLVAAAAALLLLSACQGATQPTSNPTPTATQGPIATPTPAASAMPANTASTPASATPVPTVTAAPPTTAASPTSAAITLTGDDGVTITLAAQPQKVVSLTPATSELMFALGAGDRLVGRTDYDDYPPDVASVPAVATFQGVEMEKVVNIGPDLVIAGGNNFTSAADIQRMRDLGYPGAGSLCARCFGCALRHQPGWPGGRGGGLPRPRSRTPSRPGSTRSRPRSPTCPSRARSTRSVSTLTSTARRRTASSPTWWASPVAIRSPRPTRQSSASRSRGSCRQDPEVIVLGDAAYGTCPDQVVTRPGWKGHDRGQGRQRRAGR